MSIGIAHKIRQKARHIGFDLCGFTCDFTPAHKEYILAWLKEKKYADMTWLGKNIDKRLKPERIYPGTKTAIVLGVSYAHSPTDNEYEIARYAHGKDYHLWVKEKLEELARFIKEAIVPNFHWRSFVDTGPVIERDLAIKAGLGWVGKNTCLLNAESGSYVFLGVIFCNLDLPSGRPSADQCLECRLCVDACPTEALTPYRLEPGKCLAYHNIEKRGERDREYWRAIGVHLVGCDVCQEVCPWNFNTRESGATSWISGFPKYELGNLKSLLQMTERDYKSMTKTTAISRIKYADFMRNVFLVTANQGRGDLLQDVRAWRERHMDLDLAEWKYCIEVLESLSLGMEK